jgi:hypothetical protein
MELLQELFEKEEKGRDTYDEHCETNDSDFGQLPIVTTMRYQLC